MHPLGTIKTIELEDITPEPGLLLQRAGYTWAMYKGMDPQFVLGETNHMWPGDKIGRFILSTTLLSRLMHEPAPETLRRVLAALPAMLNEEGYLGWVMAPDRADETGLANLMWSNGLTEYYRWTGDPTVLGWNRNLFESVVLPAREAFYYYPPEAPARTDGKIRWTHMSPGGETAGAFSIIEPATRGYPLFPSEALGAEIDELIRLFQGIDLLRIKAHVHATLYLTRGILRWYERQGNPAHLRFAEGLYRLYRDNAMTENYENYNWFGRPGVDGGVRHHRLAHRRAQAVAAHGQGRVPGGRAADPLKRPLGQPEGRRFRHQQLRRAEPRGVPARRPLPARHVVLLGARGQGVRAGDAVQPVLERERPGGDDPGQQHHHRAAARRRPGAPAVDRLSLRGRRVLRGAGKRVAARARAEPVHPVLGAPGERARSR